MDRALFWLVCLAALGGGIVGGIFYGFSSFVMRALARIPAEQGVAAMNAINVVVITPSFMLAFMGTGVLDLGLVVAALLGAGPPGGVFVPLAALLYVIGSFALTMAINQPMNLRLAALPAAQALAYWPGYVARWTRWNHVRTIASLASSALFVAGLLLPRAA